MRRAALGSEADNLEDARRFARMLRTLSGMSKPTIARIQGAALGGGTGLAAACDMAVASSDAVFSTSEVKFGIIPAVISPYVIRAIGPRQALRYFQSAERISAERALAIGLVNEVSPVEGLDAALATLIEPLLAGAPTAQKAAKELIAAVQGQPIDDALMEQTAQRIARQRATAEGRDGVAAFLDKRPPAWLAD
jgi:methylglutaconyl-CoA hydratase